LDHVPHVFDLTLLAARLSKINLSQISLHLGELYVR
jgi:hypothetical protein